MIRNELVYENDFESLDLNSIDGRISFHLIIQMLLVISIMMDLPSS